MANNTPIALFDVIFSTIYQNHGYPTANVAFIHGLRTSYPLIERYRDTIVIPSIFLYLSFA